MNLVESFNFLGEMAAAKKQDLKKCQQIAKGDSFSFLRCMHNKGHDDVVAQYWKWLEKQKGKAKSQNKKDYHEIKKVVDSKDYQEIVRLNKKRMAKGEPKSSDVGFKKSFTFKGMLDRAVGA